MLWLLIQFNKILNNIFFKSSDPDESLNELDEDNPNLNVSISKSLNNINNNDQLNVSPNNGNSSRVHRKYKAYTVMQRSGFQHTECVYNFIKLII